MTLIAVTSVNVPGTLRAIETCGRHVRFAASKLLTHELPHFVPPGLEVVLIPQIESSKGYSQFMLTELADHFSTSHCLIVQWDGHIIHSEHWDAAFLEYDFIGASWPQFGDGYDVGNGGFSLRSKRLVEACRAAQFQPGHPEDVAIARCNRRWLEAEGMRFAPREVADTFSAERSSAPDKTFGFHGVWHMPALLGPDSFWALYRSLDDRTSVYHDLGTIMTRLAKHPAGLRRCIKVGWDMARDRISARKELA